VKDIRLLSRSSSWLHARRRQLVAVAASGLGSALLMLAGCGPVKLVASTNIPQPLVVKIPIGVALFIPSEFSSYVHQEERWSTKWHVELGKAQSEGITRLMNAMFERVVPVDSVTAGTQVPGGVAAILEPSIEEYAFVTPRDAGSPFYAVSIKYRVNVYMPDGKLADSWGFTGYGTAPSQGLSSEAPLSIATSLAMRDAGAKLAVEFREQAVMRSLLPESDTADSAASAGTRAAPGAAPAVTTSPSGEQEEEAQKAGASDPAASGQSEESPAQAPANDSKTNDASPAPPSSGAGPGQVDPSPAGSSSGSASQGSPAPEDRDQEYRDPENQVPENQVEENQRPQPPATQSPVQQNEDDAVEVDEQDEPKTNPPDPDAVALAPPTS
jgi:hypothetical protein